MVLEHMGSGVYKITCSADSSEYIGSSIDMERRWEAHRKLLEQRKHSNKKLQRVWDQFGAEALAFTILEEVSQEELAARETHHLQESKPALNGRYTSGRKPFCLDEKQVTSVRMGDVTVELLQRASYVLQRSQGSIVEEALLEWLKTHCFTKRYQLSVKGGHTILIEIDDDRPNIKEVRPLNGVPVEQIASEYSKKFNVQVKIVLEET